MKTATRVLVPLLAVLLLAGCGDRVELHGHLSEQDANEIVAELTDKHIDADKRQDKDGVTVLVEPQDINRAVRALDAAGLPHKQRQSLGEIFRKEGIMSSPLEERARYLYALSQELEATLSQIDGVVVARVHVVLPERIAPGEPVQPASASVFIKHTADLDPDSALPRIRRLVASSIPGMANETDNSNKLAIVFMPATIYQDTRSLASFGPFLVPEQDLGFWHMVSGCLVAAPLALAALALGILVWRRRQAAVATAHAKAQVQAPPDAASDAPDGAGGQAIAPAAFRHPRTGTS